MGIPATVKDNIVYGGDVKEKIVLPFRSLGHFALESIKSKGDKLSMIDAFTGDQFTSRQVYDKIIHMVYILQSLGVKKGDVIGICSENRIEFTTTLYATIALAAIVAPFNITYSDRELDHAMNLSKPKIIFCSKGTLDKVLAVFKKNSFIEKVIVFDDVSPGPVVTPLKQLLDDKTIPRQQDFECPPIDKYETPLKQLLDDKTIPRQQDFECPPIDKYETIALIVCSSGTTGMPKGVQITHYNVMCVINTYLADKSIDFTEQTTLAVIPWFHSFGCIVMIITSCRDSKLVLLPRFEQKMFLNAIEKHKVTMAYMVPPLMVFLAKHPIVDQYDLSSLSILQCGAAPLSKETEDRIKERVGVTEIRQGYGLSESTLSLLKQNEFYNKSGSVGGVVLGHWAKVVDPETGATLGTNQRGELCFKGPHIMKGYIGDPKSTATVIKDGWLHTGDVGYYDDNLEFYIVDRIKELIKYKGFQVPPAEIEALLLTHSKIKDAAVIGKPDEASGELPFAFVVKQDGVDLTEEEVIKFVADNASPAKRLRGGVRFLDAIPKNPSGKILRRVLRESLKNPKSKL